MLRRVAATSPETFARPLGVETWRSPLTPLGVPELSALERHRRVNRYWGGCGVKASQERGRLLGDVHRGGSVRDCDGRVFPVGLRNRGGRGGSRGVPYGAQGGERPGLDVIHK